MPWLRVSACFLITSVILRFTLVSHDVLYSQLPMPQMLAC